MANRDKQRKNEVIKQLLVILLSGILSSVALNFFLIPANVLSAGMNGLAQIVSTVLSQQLAVKADAGIFIFLLNVPIFILSFVKLGKAATIFSFFNVVAVSFFTAVLPKGEVTDNIMLNAIVGGVLVGIAAGYSLKMGFTTGGLDILSVILSKTTGRTVGKYMLFMNGVIVFIAGLIYDWESALFTIVSIFCMSQVVDMIHTNHQKLTAMIITQKPDEVCRSVFQEMFRGTTLLPSRGGFSKTESTTVMIVITRYELYQLEQILRVADPNAFVNFIPTLGVIGNFANEDEQIYYKKTGQLPEMKKHLSRKK